MGEPAGWAGVTDQLRLRLPELEPGEFLVVGEPVGEPGPRRGLLRRQGAPAPGAYVQVRRDPEHWYAECVGATRFGGDLPVADQQHAHLADSGWLVPGQADPSGTQSSYPNYWRVLPSTELEALVSLCVTALATLGADPTELDWRRDR